VPGIVVESDFVIRTLLMREARGLLPPPPSGG
jgi:hypothetical protein